LKKDKEFHTVRGYQILNSENKLITSSMEDYLEMIYRTCLEDGYARINQLAMKLNVRPSSTSKVIQKLRVLGLVDYEKYGIIRLTDKGKSLGNYLLKRHKIIEEFLVNLGIKESLLKDTEMIEHDISLNTLKCFYIFNEFLSKNPDVVKIYNAFKERYKNIDIDLSYPQNK
jgi:Mn-dependent DtxR family transcriptional regulator